MKAQEAMLISCFTASLFPLGHISAAFRHLVVSWQEYHCGYCYRKKKKNQVNSEDKADPHDQ